jgi:hypothetical protein
MLKYFIQFMIPLISFFIGYFSYKFIGPDNQVEQSCEKIIKEKTGLDIDISPEENK